MRSYNKLFTSVLFALVSLSAASAAERKSLFNDNRQFHLTDSLTVDMRTESIADSLWHDVTLPPDWSVTLTDRTCHSS